MSQNDVQLLPKRVQQSLDLPPIHAWLATGPCGGAQVFHEPMSAKVLVERMELVRHMVDEAQRIAPDRITFHWSCPCQVNSVLA